MTSVDTIWAARVAESSGLPDLRLQSRFAKILVDKQESPMASITREVGGNAGQAKATYRFYGNERVKSAHLSQGFALETARRCLQQEKEILWIQDTTTLNFTGLHSIAELGPIDSGSKARGLHVHTTMAVSVEGNVLGILDQQCWARPQAVQAKDKAKRKESSDKESAKWINGIDNAREAWFNVFGREVALRILHVMDRESDTYEAMMYIEEIGDSAIIRSAQNRLLDEPLAKAHDAVRKQSVLCETVIAVKRKAGEPAREALVEVRVLEATLRADYQKYPHAWPMKWNLVEAWEPYPPQDVEPLHWLLWTREIIETAADALEVVRKYTCRWPIEEVHLVLKSGCKIEELRLESWDGLEKAVRINSAVAARIVLLRDEARERPNSPALEILSPDEAAVLTSRFAKTKKLTPAELTIAQAVLWIARLGGHLNRKGDGMPGVRTLWYGLQALTLLVDGFRAGINAARDTYGNKCG